MTIKYNRAAYMNNECTFDQYYSQFVTPAMCDNIGVAIGVERIKQSTDESFNDIPLREWDSVALLVKSYCGNAMAHSNASTSNGVLCASLSDFVCVAKTAAKQIRDNK
jgi:hypothetical protein